MLRAIIVSGEWEWPRRGENNPMQDGGLHRPYGRPAGLMCSNDVQQHVGWVNPDAVTRFSAVLRRPFCKARNLRKSAENFPHFPHFPARRYGL